MSLNSKGLGRGLDALFNGVARNAEEVAPQKLAIKDIVPNPAQPRRIFEDESLRELAESIRAQGILQPILVRPTDDGKFQIIAGERRWRAAELANLSVVPVIVKVLDDTEAMAVALIENLQREDLNPMEEARAMSALKETLAISQEELATRLGKSRPAVTNSIRLLQLSDDAQADVEKGNISAGHARCLLGIADSEMAENLRLKIINEGMTVREAEKAAASYKQDGVFPWDKVSPELAPQSRQKDAPSDNMRVLAGKLTEKLGCPVRINGNEEKGKISLSFKNKAQLDAILSNFGVGFNDSF